MSTDLTRRVPGATYRLQLHEGFTLDHAAEIVDYLADLGITHIYCSPILQAAAHSPHGYDTVDHSSINAELGGREAFDRLSAAARRRGLGIVLDIVPNHMGVGDRTNRQWWDVLERGRASEYAGWFDIDWDAPACPGKVFLPVLGAALDDVVSAGELTLDSGGGEPVLRYYESAFPIAAGTAGGDVAEVAARQHYQLAFWRESASLNYRRFFDVTPLAGVRIEDQRVFEQTHALIESLIAGGQVDGLRVDHPDGLADPLGYFGTLAARNPQAWVVAEKIVEPGERLDDRWQIAGTSGYDALYDVNGVFVDPAGDAAMTDLFREMTGVTENWSDLAYDAQLQVIDQLFIAELDWLSRVAAVDLPADELRAALRELVACFPVYRSYLRTGEEPRPGDVAALAAARADAVGRRPDLAEAVGVIVDELLDTSRDSELRVRFQQTTGPVMAKGVEDTAFYRYNRLVSLNEVGGDPGSFAMSVDEFHAACVARQRHWPASMTSLSTHDTKRSEDVRARISVLVQTPSWPGRVRDWFTNNARHWTVAPDRSMEYLLYQTVVGAWPLPLERAQEYAEKASREAKQRTSWIEPDPEYDQALQSFVAALYEDAFVVEVEQIVNAGVLSSSRFASIAQKLVQLTMPGVPDIYQGTELWDLSLVDPDNRRPVDYAERRRLLALATILGPDQRHGYDSQGLTKIFVVQSALAVRKRLPDVFADGDYVGLTVDGEGAEVFLAFMRGDQVITLVPRFAGRIYHPLPATITLPAGSWHNVFTGVTFSGTVDMETLLSPVFVALLERV
ncbi:MAG: malto-oligosyltrehalose synthase [Mycobacteriales bacterium]